MRLESPFGRSKEMAFRRLGLVNTIPATVAGITLAELEHATFAIWCVRRRSVLTPNQLVITTLPAGNHGDDAHPIGLTGFMRKVFSHSPFAFQHAGEVIHRLSHDTDRPMTDRNSVPFRKV